MADSAHITELSGDSAHRGAPSYIELCVDDADKARSFYGALLGWTVRGDKGPGQASTGGLDVGIHDRDSSSLLEVFFTVRDLDSAMARLTELGGQRSARCTPRTPLSARGWSVAMTKVCDSGCVSHPADRGRRRTLVALTSSRTDQ